MVKPNDRVWLPAEVFSQRLEKPNVSFFLIKPRRMPLRFFWSKQNFLTFLNLEKGKRFISRYLFKYMSCSVGSSLLSSRFAEKTVVTRMKSPSDCVLCPVSSCSILFFVPLVREGTCAHSRPLASAAGFRQRPANRSRHVDHGWTFLAWWSTASPSCSARPLPWALSYLPLPREGRLQTQWTGARVLLSPNYRGEDERPTPSRSTACRSRETQASELLTSGAPRELGRVGSARRYLTA